MVALGWFIIFVAGIIFYQLWDHYKFYGIMHFELLVMDILMFGIGVVMIV